MNIHNATVAVNSTAANELYDATTLRSVKYKERKNGFAQTARSHQAILITAIRLSTAQPAGYVAMLNAKPLRAIASVQHCF